MKYDAFGNTIYESNAENVKYRFSSKEWDSVAQLYYYGFRYYNPAHGIWTTKDPLGISAGDLNVYRMVYNNPVGFVDVYGFYTNEDIERELRYADEGQRAFMYMAKTGATLDETKQLFCTEIITMHFITHKKITNKIIYLFAQLFWFVNTIILVNTRPILIEISEALNKPNILISNIIFLVPSTYMLLLCVIYTLLHDKNNILYNRIIKLSSYFSIICSILFIIYIFYHMDVLMRGV